MVDATPQTSELWLVMRALIRAELPLEEPTAESGLVTWFDITIVKSNERQHNITVGQARAAIVHVGKTEQEGANLWCVLDAAHPALESMHPIYFRGTSFRDEFTDGTGHDLLFIEHVTIEPAYRGRNIDFAVVRRLCDTLGVGCALAAMECLTEQAVRHWHKMGFRISLPGCELGAMHLLLSRRRRRVVDTNDRSGYWVVPVEISDDGQLN